MKVVFLVVVYFILNCFDNLNTQVTVDVDYIQPANQGFPEKTCCSVTIGGM